MKATTVLLFVFLLTISACSLDDNFSSESADGATLSGSYSTMLTLNNKLYLVSKTKIYTYDATNSKDPILIDTKELGFNIESLLHYNNYLFIGSQSNMYIFSIDDKGIPQRESETQYFSNDNDVCNSDPIIVRNDIAYVTLATETTVCGRSVAVNELRVYDVSDIKSPILINTIEMQNPKGLGLGKTKLFICDKRDGLVIFDISNPNNPTREKDFQGFETYDLIVKNNILLVVAKDELLQYDITNESDIKLLSTIEL